MGRYKEYLLRHSSKQSVHGSKNWLTLRLLFDCSRLVWVSLSSSSVFFKRHSNLCFSSSIYSIFFSRCDMISNFCQRREHNKTWIRIHNRWPNKETNIVTYYFYSAVRLPRFKIQPTIFSVWTSQEAKSRALSSTGHINDDEDFSCAPFAPIKTFSSLIRSCFRLFQFFPVARLMWVENVFFGIKMFRLNCFLVCQNQFNFYFPFFILTTMIWIKK